MKLFINVYTEISRNLSSNFLNLGSNLLEVLVIILKRFDIAVSNVPVFYEHNRDRPGNVM